MPVLCPLARRNWDSWENSSTLSCTCPNSPFHAMVSRHRGTLLSPASGHPGESAPPSRDAGTPCPPPDLRARGWCWSCCRPRQMPHQPRRHRTGEGRKGAGPRWTGCRRLAQRGGAKEQAYIRAPGGGSGHCKEQPLFPLLPTIKKKQATPPPGRA